MSQLNRYAKSILESDSKLRAIYVKGEISGITIHRASGHIYMTLKDSTSSIKAVMFKGNASHLRFVPENGMSVVVFGQVSLFERDGGYQLYVSQLVPEGVGELHVAFSRLKDKLAAEGLFDENKKRDIPTLPEVIGVVTSREGAALTDVVSVLSRRYPLGKLLLCHSSVQGKGSAEQIASGIKRLSDSGCDVIIVTRGGGSMEELWSFNEEVVVRAVANCTVPIISAVGHESDFTLCDMAADLRAPTPSVAAELVGTDIKDLKEYTDRLSVALRAQMMSVYNESERRLSEIASNAVFRSPFGVLEPKEKKLERLNEELMRKGRQITPMRSERLSGIARALDALSPLKVLERGYSVTFDESGRVVDSPTVGDCIRTVTAKSEILSTVTEVNLK